jgi:hypothetical protein
VAWAALDEAPAGEALDRAPRDASLDQGVQNVDAWVREVGRIGEAAARGFLPDLGVHTSWPRG